MSDYRPMPFRFVIILVLSIVCVAVPARANMRAGQQIDIAMVIEMPNIRPELINVGFWDAYDRGAYETAFHEWRHMAEQGDAQAQGNLGMLYAQGQGVPQDYIQAHMWYNLAGAYGAKEWAERRDALAKQMTPDQIAEAQKLAREWKPKPYNPPTR